MKPFDLEAAKRGEPIVTRDGRPAKFIAHVPEARDTQRRVVVLIEGAVLSAQENGRYFDSEAGTDLCMAPKPKVKKEGWVNMYPNAESSGRVYESKSLADALASSRRVACCRIEWEEEAR